MINVTKHMAETPKIIQNKLKKHLISPHTAHRMSVLFSHILRNSGSAAEADAEAARYFNGLDGRFRPFLSLLLLFLPLFMSAQTTFPISRWETPDSIVLEGEYMSLKVFPKQDSLVLLLPGGDYSELPKPITYVSAVSPSTGNQYFCYLFNKLGDNEIVIEYTYNVRTRLWGLCVTYEDRLITAGMPVIQPFPPLRKPVPALKPTTAHR